MSVLSRFSCLFEHPVITAACMVGSVFKTPVKQGLLFTEELHEYNDHLNSVIGVLYTKVLHGYDDHLSTVIGVLYTEVLHGFNDHLI